MKASIQSKLESISERHEEIAAMLGDAQIISDQDKFRTLSKEYSQLEPIVSAFAGFQEIE